MECNFTPDRVTLKDPWCLNALDKEADYLLSLENGRLLAGFYENAGRKTPFVRYGGWESHLIGGHTLGHYLSALSLAATNGGIAGEKREKLLKKLGACVAALKECQFENGFLWGAPIPRGDFPESQFDNVEKGKLDITTQAWVPWYTMHKLLAGLIDACTVGGIGDALGIASRLGDWVYARISRLNKRMRNKLLSVEYGGMNDCLYSLYALTGKTEHAEAAHFFDEEELFDGILSEGRDLLDGVHANTTIPKVLGALNRYLVMHGRTVGGQTIDAERYLHVAEAFFRIVTERHTYVTGGNSEWERFGKDYVLDAERTNCNCETCNVYNMLKLARRLFSITGDKRYTDYYDNAFTNSILSSQNAETGMTTYFQPMASGFFKVYSSPYDSFWCCTGSGMESLSKLGDSVVYLRAEEIAIEQYLSCAFENEDVSFTLSCDFPTHERGILRIKRAKSPLMFRLRIPDWADGEPAVGINGVRISPKTEEGHILFQAREGDVVLFAIPVSVTLKGLPDGGALAFRHGGVVLSADLGEDDMKETFTGVDVRIPERRGKMSDSVYFPDLAAVLEEPKKFLKREKDCYYLEGGDRRLRLVPHYQRNFGRYAIYLQLREGERGEEAVQRVPFDTVQCGYGQYESDELHALSECGSRAGTDGVSYRVAGQKGWFSYDLAVDPTKKNVLSFELSGAENGKTLQITAAGEIIHEETLFYHMGEKTYRKEVVLPPPVVAAARKKSANGREYSVVRVCFRGLNGRASARICGFLHIYTDEKI